MTMCACCSNNLEDYGVYRKGAMYCSPKCKKKAFDKRLKAKQEVKPHAKITVTNPDHNEKEANRGLNPQPKAPGFLQTRKFGDKQCY